jgi:hypothetical protein
MILLTMCVVILVVICLVKYKKKRLVLQEEIKTDNEYVVPVYNTSTMKNDDLDNPLYESTEVDYMSMKSLAFSNISDDSYIYNSTPMANVSF